MINEPKATLEASEIKAQMNRLCECREAIEVLVTTLTNRLGSVLNPVDSDENEKIGRNVECTSPLGMEMNELLNNLDYNADKMRGLLNRLAI